jgi:hypothetical protein
MAKLTKSWNNFDFVHYQLDQRPALALDFIKYVFIILFFHLHYCFDMVFFLFFLHSDVVLQILMICYKCILME